MKKSIFAILKATIVSKSNSAIAQAASFTCKSDDRVAKNSATLTERKGDLLWINQFISKSNPEIIRSLDDSYDSLKGWRG